MLLVGFGVGVRDDERFNWLFFNTDKSVGTKIYLFLGFARLINHFAKNSVQEFTSSLFKQWRLYNLEALISKKFEWLTLSYFSSS